MVPLIKLPCNIVQQHDIHLLHLQVSEQYKQMTDQYTQLAQQVQTLNAENTQLKQAQAQSQQNVPHVDVASESSQPTSAPSQGMVLVTDFLILIP